MNRPAIDRIFSVVAACNELATIDYDNVPVWALRNLAGKACHAHETNANPWPAIEAARDLLYRIDPQPGPAIHDEPPARGYWLRAAWLDLVRAACEAVDAGDEDADRWQHMHAGQLAEELAYLGDFQG